MSDPHPLIIIGSGPAGYTAAIYAARANLAPLVIEGAQSGGSLMTTTEVENFPGFPDGITGPELMDNLRKQADRFGAQFLTDDVTRVDLTGDVKTVWVGQQSYQAWAVILATGSAWRPLGVPGETELLGHGVSSCATCDGFFFRDQDIAVIGGGDSAMEEATFLTRFARSVTIIPGDTYDALLLAVSGLERIGRADRITHPIDVDTMVPAIGSGTLVLQCRDDDTSTLDLVASLGDPRTARETVAERTLLHILQGNCHSPIAALARTEPDGRLGLRARVLSLDGKTVLDAHEWAADPVTLGTSVAAALLRQGARELLDLPAHGSV
ncbi:FAD-dependent oxidoreductase [Micromonospora sp. NBC_00617]|uniref:FAD-dependent oxidoreductase n=1 Tax=Micromonospora sp. NBC_00617 TaxID=2903587 RepID=UPI0030E23718